MRRFSFCLLFTAAVCAGTAHAASSKSSYPKLETAMPAAITGPAGTAVSVFKKTSPSIYLIIAAKNGEALKRGKEVYEGSAVAISPTLALTNCHIVNKREVLILEQGKQKDAVTVVAQDVKADKCIIKASAMKLHPIPGVRPYGGISVGEKVYTIGNPSGLTSTLSEGIVSGLRTQKGVRYVQTSAPISPGSSGGGLFDERGNLLGITSFGIEHTGNLNFAIAAEDYWGAAHKSRRSRHKDDQDE